MKTIDQLSIFLENKTGRLSEITDMLAKAGVSIRTLELVEAGDFGILRIIVTKPQEVKEVLHDNGISAKITPVIAIEIEDEVGCFNRVIKLLSQKGIDISYTYTYTANSGSQGAFVIKTDIADIERTISILEEDGVKILDAV